MALLLVGCASSPGPNKQIINWANDRGGLLADSRKVRLNKIAIWLFKGSLDRRPWIGVLDMDRLAAYSWTGGQVFASRGLIDRLNDDELAAVLAHEAGHLLSNGNVHAMFSLKGIDNSDAECKADEIGCKLLGAKGIAPSALASVLQKLQADPSLPTKTKALLTARIERLQGRCE